jgi:hypothetical protein
MAVAIARPWRAASIAADSLMLVAVVACIPFAILAIGLPVAAVVRLGLWVAERF